jgi:hypothetical protein
VFPVLQPQVAQGDRIGGIGIDAGTLDAAFPLVAVDVGGKRRGERQDEKTKGQRRTQDEDKRCPAERETLDQEDRGNVEQARRQEPGDHFRCLRFQFRQPPDVTKDAGGEKEQAEGGESAKQLV